MANRIPIVDQFLENSFNQEEPLEDIPEPMDKVLDLLAKSMKQRKMTVFLGILSLVNFCLGHASIKVHHFWNEPSILWIAINLQTGRCKSTFHEYLSNLLDKVDARVKQRNEQTKTMLLPHCTWDKFGEILANSGGRILGLFDEMVSFFSTMNMYSSSKLQLTDSREYQDFLQLYTGKAKGRETLGGNANFDIKRTSFTMIGFTQPTTALPIIQDIQNNAKGFTSRILWYFPKPVYSKLKDFLLTEEEHDLIIHFEEELINFLATLYIYGEATYSIAENGKKVEVEVFRTEFILSEEAMKEFESIHDDWEMNLCQKYPSDVLVGGLFSRGRSQILRLSVPIHILLSSHEVYANADDRSLDPDNDAPSSSEVQHLDRDTEDEEHSGAIDLNTTISLQALQIAHAIVKTSLHQICVLNGRQYIIGNQDDADCLLGNGQEDCLTEDSSPDKEAEKCILRVPGPIVSSSEMTRKYQFRKLATKAKTTVKVLVDSAFAQLESLGLGHVETYVIKSNKSQVKFFIKTNVPENEEEKLQFSRNLSSVKISLQAFKMAFDDCDNGLSHQRDYENRKCQESAPCKKQKVMSQTEETSE